MTGTGWPICDTDTAKGREFFFSVSLGYVGAQVIAWIGGSYWLSLRQWYLDAAPRALNIKVSYPKSQGFSGLLFGALNQVKK